MADKDPGPTGSNTGHACLGYAEKAYELAPKSPEVADTLGWIHLRHGDPKRGLELIRQAATYAPHNAEIRYHLAVALHKNARDEEAHKELERLLGSRNEFPQQEEAKRLLAELKGS